MKGLPISIEEAKLFLYILHFPNQTFTEIADAYVIAESTLRIDDKRIQSVWRQNISTRLKKLREERYIVGGQRGVGYKVTIVPFLISAPDTTPITTKADETSNGTTEKYTRTSYTKNEIIDEKLITKFIQVVPRLTKTPVPKKKELDDEMKTLEDRKSKYKDNLRVIRLLDVRSNINDDGKNVRGKTQPEILLYIYNLLKNIKAYLLDKRDLPHEQFVKGLTKFNEDKPLHFEEDSLDVNEYTDYIELYSQVTDMIKLLK